ncbi:MAG: SDR family NAD(P)-dependent oxidoreductase, partial [Hyphomicrobiaceae bacterium]
MRLKDKVAIITGAASGMGAATARIFAREGAFVVLTDMNDEDGQKVAREIGNRATYIHHDVSSEADWTKVVADTMKAHGRLDILINNAGV